MKRLRSKGLAVALLAAALSVLGVGTSAAHSPADQQKFAAQPREGGDDPVSKLACTLQMKQGSCEGHPGGGSGGGGSGGQPKAGGDDPISKLMCGLQGGKGGGDCQSKPGGGDGGGSGGGGSGGSPSHPPHS